MSDSLEAIFALNPPYPAINFEPYYTGWNHEINKPGARPHFCDALGYASRNFMRHLGAVLRSEGNDNANLYPAREDLQPHRAPGAPH